MRPPLSADDDALLETLAARKPSELIPLLLELARRHSARRRPADLLAQLSRDTFVLPSAIDQRVAARFDAAALEVASDYQAILLSPLAPLGTCSVVSPTTQDRSVTTSRTTEVVSDPTNVLALECARRLLANETHVRLCTIHQVVRPQRFDPRQGFSQHFRLFALAEAGFARPEHAFEVEAVCSLASIFLRLFDKGEALGCRFPNRRAGLHVAANAAALGDRVRRRLASQFPELPVESTPLESGYYDGLRLLVGAETPAGLYVELGDVGVFDWVQKLTSNRRTRLVAAGLGIQMFPLVFAGDAVS
jgi:hypothetical protein